MKIQIQRDSLYDVGIKFYGSLVTCFESYQRGRERERERESADAGIITVAD